MKTYAESMSIIDDLKICLVSNSSKHPFITSDDPAILSNRWHLNDDRTKHRSFGLGASGCLLFLPLTPKIMLVAYDSDVYSIPHKNGWAKISHINDIKAFNQHQFLNCRSNIFLKDMTHSEFVNKSFCEIIKNRPSARHRIHYSILDYQDEWGARYKVVDHQTAEHHKEALIHTEMIHCHPTAWPSIIQRRDNGTVYTNGTGLGFLRKSHIPLGNNTFHKESTNLKKHKKHRHKN